MNNLLWLRLLCAIASLSSCDKLTSISSDAREKISSTLSGPPPFTSSKDFWIDRCEIKYRGKDFPIMGSISDVVALLGPYDRFSERGFRYFWDDIGVEISTPTAKGGPISTTINFNRIESSMEIVLRELGTPEALQNLADIKSASPQGFFKGELVFEGALIGHTVIDFDLINKTRKEYFKTQSGPDAYSIDIEESWSAKRYAFERLCANGMRIGFLFTLLTGENVKSNQIEVLAFGSNNDPDSTKTHDVDKRE